MPRTLPKPPIASWNIMRAAFLGTGLSILFTFLSWLFSSIADWARDNSFNLTLSIREILAGSAFLPLSMYGYWAWRPKRKYGHWHRWIHSWLGSWYVSFLPLVGGMTYWNVLLDEPRNFLVNTVAIALFGLMWALPALSYPLAKRLLDMQYGLDLKLLKFGAPAALMIMVGILGASFGLYGSLDGRILALAFLFPVVSLGLAQYFAASLWPYRPWAKEEEE